MFQIENVLLKTILSLATNETMECSLFLNKKKKGINVSPASVQVCWAWDSFHSELEVSVWIVLLWPVATNNISDNTNTR